MQKSGSNLNKNKNINKKKFVLMIKSFVIFFIQYIIEEIPANN